MRTLQPLTTLALLVLLTACASPWQTDRLVTPSSYASARGEIPRTVGLLRRLAVLGVNRAAPKACAGQTNRETTVLATPNVFSPAIDHVRREKSYELVMLDPERHAPWLNAPDNAGFLDELIASMLVATPDSAPAAAPDAAPGPRLRALLTRLHEADRIDGLLVLFLDHNCPRGNDATRTLLGLLSLGVTEMTPDASLDTPLSFYHAAIYESARGVPVWRHDISEAGIKARNQFNIFVRKERSWFEHLFDDLEPALPAVLTR